MVLGENLRVAFFALRANKMRSILTTLGIIIGVAAVVAVVSIVQGLQFMITRELQGVGATYVMVVPQRDEQRGPGIVARQVRLTWEDGQAIQEGVRGIRLMTPLVGGGSSSNSATATTRPSSSSASTRTGRKSRTTPSGSGASSRASTSRNGARWR